MRITSEHFQDATDVFRGLPAFVLGNGPTLPEHEALACLDPFITIGVNRILYRYDPTFLHFYDSSVVRDMRTNIDGCRAVCLTGPMVSAGPKVIRLQTVGEMGDYWTIKPPTPGQIGVTGSSGVSCAYWARSLGCDPIYLLGMSGRPDEEGQTDFWGTNTLHDRNPAMGPTMPHIFAMTEALCRNHWAVRIATVEQLEAVVQNLPRHDRATYQEILTKRHPGFHAT